jgi:hypothetical protein
MLGSGGQIPKGEAIVMGIVGSSSGNPVGLALPYIVMWLTSQGGQRSVLHIVESMLVVSLHL